MLERVPLDAGRRIDVDTAIRVPSQLGRWALALDIVDDVDGSFAKLGTEPTITVFEVVAPRGLEPVD